MITPPSSCQTLISGCASDLTLPSSRNGPGAVAAAAIGGNGCGDPLARVTVAAYLVAECEVLLLTQGEVLASPP
jgi:hypothetical protein